MKIMVFLHGTSIMHRAALGKTREERVQQVIAGAESVRDFASSIPVDGAVQKLDAWRQQGAEMVYLSSHTHEADVKKDRAVLQRYGFPAGPIYYRQNGEQYADVAAAVLPDVLIEDDCESIGGEPEMTYPHLDPEVRPRIKSIVVKEFQGIDHLPDDLHLLMDPLIAD